MSEPNIDVNLAIELGLSEEEYDKILSLLGRVPTYTELGIFSVMWSEHCSYKNSIALLKTLPRTGERILAGAGEENAGLVNIGDGLAVAFKIESHNHPSAIEPYQGAATGVGGILRDIFTMGARPIAALNSLRFGNLNNDRVRHLLKEVVKGIGNYGNSFGVPTVSGEVYFDDCYNGNPLVNAMAVGIVDTKHSAKAIASVPGSSVMLVGSATGRDGIHGATFASLELNEESEAKRPAVQVGDPFSEKKLMEATLEAIKAGYVLGIQDMGAAGLTCSSAEMSAKGNLGMDLELDLVPVREEKMSSYEIMLSESQERMLLVTDKKDEEAVIKIFEKWDLPAVRIGKVTSDRKIKVRKDGRVDAEIDPFELVLGGGAPVYMRESREPEYIGKLRSMRSAPYGSSSNVKELLLKLLCAPNISSRKSIFEQYDSMVQGNNVIGSGGDCAIVRIDGTKKALALKTDCNARFVYMNPKRGTEIAIAEAARNVVCVGAKPIAITNCLNFGNPYDPEIFWQFKEAIAGMKNACEVLDTPVTGGNVSFYNENPAGAVYPTPVIGMLGLIEDVDLICTHHFKDPGDIIMLLGRTDGNTSGSEFANLHGVGLIGEVPELDLQYEKRLQQLILHLIQHKLIKSAHDLSEGGFGIALCESLFNERCQLGAKINLGVSELDIKEMLFSEDQSRILISLTGENLSEVKRLAEAHLIDIAELGITTEDAIIRINDEIEIAVRKAKRVYESALERMLV